MRVVHRDAYKEYLFIFYTCIEQGRETNTPARNTLTGLKEAREKEGWDWQSGMSMQCDLSVGHM